MHVKGCLGLQWGNTRTWCWIPASTLCNFTTGSEDTRTETDETERASRFVSDQRQRRKVMRGVIGWVSNAARPDG
jgi:hypothetical protein